MSQLPPKSKNIDVSIVCPFYNEANIIENAARGMLAQLEAVSFTWELILVNDGSTDNSLDLLTSSVGQHDRVRILTYQGNEGRGFALKTGIDAACGDYVVTTEVDLSWGETIVADLYKAITADERIDAVVASPNLKPGGGYRNVPFKRILISKVGNAILRLLFSRRVSMYTGMTRVYRRDVIQALDTEERGKEFHLEVLFKIMALGYPIGEIPAVLAWQDAKLAKAKTSKRKSSSNIPKLILSHLNFAIFSNPLRYFWSLSILSLLGALGFFGAAVYNLFTGGIAIFLALTSFFLGCFALLFLGFGVVTAQNNRILKEIWRRDALKRVKSITEVS